MYPPVYIQITQQRMKDIDHSGHNQAGLGEWESKLLSPLLVPKSVLEFSGET